MMPGSPGERSVHSGQRCLTRCRDSSSNCWKLRSSRLGEGKDMGSGSCEMQVEAELLDTLRGAHAILQDDEQLRRILRALVGVELQHFDARLPAIERALHEMLGQARGRVVV